MWVFHSPAMTRKKRPFPQPQMTAAQYGFYPIDLGAPFRMYYEHWTTA
jgi:hypothetical protein